MLAGTLDVRSALRNVSESPQFSAIASSLVPASDFSIYSSVEIVEDWEESAILNSSLWCLGTLESVAETPVSPPLAVAPVSSEHAIPFLCANTLDVNSTLFVIYVIHQVTTFLPGVESH